MQKTTGPVFIKRYKCNHFNVNKPVIIIGVGKN